jgi:predicted metal-binding protein
MRVRHVDDFTPEGLLASVAMSLCDQFGDRHAREGCGPKHPDVADFREAFRPYLERELLRARIDEARQSHAVMLTGRMRELDEKLRALDKAIARLESQS